jgi:Kef-type K+ transport system membrane component KefB
VEPLLAIGILLVGGFAVGELAEKVGLPKVTGYITAGILLNPGLFGFMPAELLDSTEPVTNIALAFITFSVGGTISLARIRRLGRSIGLITVFEAEFAFLAVAAGFLVLAPVLVRGTGLPWLAAIVPLSLLVGSLASPTDPSATLAVAHEYRAKGDVSSTIMGVAAMDDALGIINYSLATAAAVALAGHAAFSVTSSLIEPLVSIVGAIALGVAFGLVFNGATRLFRKESEGYFIVLVLGMLGLCFGVARLLGVDELLPTMSMGIFVVNTNPQHEKIFRVLERYTEQLIFVLFFTLSAMHLDLGALARVWPLALVFVVLRAGGKYGGTRLGARLGRAPAAVKRWAAAGLIPQGGIVIGLALLLKQNPALDRVSDLVLNLIIGAVVIHELVGPVLARLALRRAGEIGGPASAGNDEGS